jgi:hypothetical protein
MLRSLKLASAQHAALHVIFVSLAGAYTPGAALYTLLRCHHTSLKCCRLCALCSCKVYFAVAVTFSESLYTVKFTLR